MPPSRKRKKAAKSASAGPSEAMYTCPTSPSGAEDDGGLVLDPSKYPPLEYAPLPEHFRNEEDDILCKVCIATELAKLPPAERPTRLKIHLAWRANYLHRRDKALREEGEHWVKDGTFAQAAWLEEDQCIHCPYVPRLWDARRGLRKHYEVRHGYQWRRNTVHPFTWIPDNAGVPEDEYELRAFYVQRKYRLQLHGVRVSAQAMWDLVAGPSYTTKEEHVDAKVAAFKRSKIREWKSLSKSKRGEWQEEYDEQHPHAPKGKKTVSQKRKGR